MRDIPLLEYILRTAANLTAIWLCIGPLGRWQGVSIEDGQCFFGMLSCHIVLSVRPIRFGEVLLCVQVSMRGKVIPDHLAVLHHKPDALEFCDVGERISGYGDEVSKFPGLESAHAILPAQHFRSIRGDGAKDV